MVLESSPGCDFGYLRRVIINIQLVEVVEAVELYEQKIRLIGWIIVEILNF
jgi:hypothetical protein